MIMETKSNLKSSMMAGNQSAIYQVESFLEEFYLFRRNVLNGKTEFFCIKPEEEMEDSEEKELEKKEETLKEESPEEKNWKVLTAEAFNSIVRCAKKLGIGEKKSPRQDIEEYIKSDAVPVFDPIQEYMNKLPKWDGKNHVAALFGRIPGLTSEQLAWCATWFRSAVAHWLQMDMLPEELRQYFLDHINFGNKFDSEMALTHNLIVNVDELANITVAQQGKLKQTLSKVKVNGRPIFGKSQADRRRYASFLATTNDEHPLCDPTGSRRYLCLRVPDGEFIDNNSAINYDQLYAQMVYELRDKKTPYWFTNDEVARIQECNLPFFKVDDLEPMINYCFRMPEEKEEGKWMVSSEVFDVLHLQYPMLVGNMSTKVKIGQTLKFMGYKSKHTKHGQAYQLFALSA